MKPSPLQLEWLVYPAASFRAQPRAENTDNAVPVKVAAKVTYHLDSPHSVELCMSSDDDQADNGHYTFELEAIAAFSFDLAQARAAYRTVEPSALPQVIAVNVARIVYSAGREFLATLTARAPQGSLLVKSVLIGPGDVELGSVEPQKKVLKELFDLEPPSVPKKKTPSRGKAKAD